MRAERAAVVGALAALTALAAWPLVRLGYPTAGDGLIHFYRLVQLDHLLRSGVFYPRWAADLAYGFGYPVFNFYPPLVYYLGALLHGLGLSYANALLGVYVGALALAVSGAYVLAHERWGRLAGLMAAAAYALAPYFYFNALARGALPETVGLGLLPWVLWAYARLAREARPARFAAAAVLNAVLILSHLLSAVLAAPLVVVTAWAALRESKPSAVGSRQRLAASSAPNFRLLIANYLLSLGLAAFFLLPALLELDAVQVGQLTTPGDLDFHNHFLSWRDLLAWPRPYDERLVFNAVPASLSGAAVVMALSTAAVGIGTGLAPVGSRGQVAQGSGQKIAGDVWKQLSAETWLVVALLVLVGLTLPLSVRVWENVPLLALVQFPWRLVGPAGLLLALLAGAGVSHVERATWAQRRGVRPALLASALGLLWVWSLAWSYGPASQAAATADLNSLHAYERATGQLGTTSTGEFLPDAVRALPDPLALEAAYAAGRPTARLAAPPGGVTVLGQSASALHAAAEVEAATPAALTFNLFDFPGWQATVDGQPAAITPSVPNGLITVAVPAGRHVVEVRFGSTPVRTVSTLLSLLAVAMLGALTWRLGRQAPATFAAPPHATRHTPTRFEAHTITFAALLLLLLRVTVLDPRPTPFARSRFDGAAVSGVDRLLDVNFDNQLVLIGLDGPPAKVRADEAFGLTLYWRAQTVPGADYAATVQVVDEAGHLFGQSDSQHPGRVPTSRWTTSQYARDEHQLRLLPGTPPGTYRLVAGVYQVEGLPLAVLDANLAPQGQAAELGTLTVTPARQPAVPAAAHPIDTALGPLRLRGYSVNTGTPQAGDELRFTFFWEAEAGPRPDAAVRLVLVAGDGTVLAETTQPPAPTHPTSAWAAGEVVRQPLDLRVPATVPAGTATLRLSLAPAEAPEGAPLGGPFDLAELQVTVPERQFEVPAMQHALNAPVGAGVTLLGYDLAPTGTLTLYWQPQALLEAGYKVFVHALAADGAILAQTDTVPAAGARPTTSWLPGEIITDPHALPLAGAARLAVGLYAEDSGERLGMVMIELP